jgi:hypothetical protein
MRGSVWFGVCRTYERLLPLVRDDAALERRGVGSAGGFSEDGEGRCACGLGMVQAVWAARPCECCGQRRLGVGTAPAGDARRKEGGSDARFGLDLSCAGRTSASSRSCATMRPSSGRGVASDGAFAWMRRGVAHAASRWLRRCGPRGCARLVGKAPPRVRPIARREEGVMRGSVWIGVCSSYERLLPLVRDDAALERARRCERRGLSRGCGGALRMRHRDG